MRSTQDRCEHATTSVARETDRERITTTLFASGLLGLLAGVSSVICYLSHEPIMGTANVVGAAIAAAAFATTLRGFRYLAGNLALIGLAGIVVVGILEAGGVQSPDLFWLILLPQAAGLLLGGRFGILWGGVVSVIAVGFWWLETVGWSPWLREPPSIDTVIYEFFTVMVGTLALTAAFILGRNRSTCAREGSIAALRHEVAERRLAEQAACTSAKLAREAEQQAREASESRKLFIASVSHEIRTPLNGILGIAHLMQQEPMDPAHLRDLRLIQSSGHTLLELLNDVLDLGKFEAGGLELEQIACCPRTLFQEVASLHRTAATRKGLELNVEVDPAVPEAFIGDPTRVRQILNNLVGNAVKFTMEGHVDVRAKWSDGLVIEVQDTGIGVPQDKLDRLFQPFRQVEASTSRQFGGTGLGLAITQELTRAMGGSIEVQSTFGEGTLFRVTLAVVAGDLPTEEIPLPSSHLDLEGRILVIDDHPVNRLVARRMIEALGVDVQLASSGFEAIEMLREDLPDLVLIDIEMPDMDGYETTAKIRELGPGQASLPIVALTANMLDESDDRAPMKHLDGHLAKPIDPVALRVLCQRWLARSKAA